MAHPQIGPLSAGEVAGEPDAVGVRHRPGCGGGGVETSTSRSAEGAEVLVKTCRGCGRRALEITDWKLTETSKRYREASTARLTELTEQFRRPAP